MKTLITGISGFMGYYFNKNVIDSPEIYYLTRNNFFNKNSKNLIFGDLDELNTIEKVKKEKFDRLIHFAWQGLPNKNKALNLVNYNMTINLIESVLYSNANCEINLIGSCLEKMNLNNSEIRKKLNAETQDFILTKRKILNFLMANTKNYRWFRVHYAYGFHQHKDSLFNYAYSCFKKSKIPQIYNMNTSHDFIYAQDAAKLINDFIYKTKCKGIIDLGTGSSISNYQFVKAIASGLGLNLNLINEPEKNFLEADTNKIKLYLPEFIFTPLNKSIQQVISELN